MAPLLAVLGLFAYNGALTYSSLNFLPTTLLRLTPTISSTTSLIWAWDEHSAFSAWIDDAASRSEADRLLPSWFRCWAKRGNYVLFSSFWVSMSAGLANVLDLDRGFTTSWALDSPRPWFGLGTFFALAHMFYGPRALPLLAEIQRKEGESGEGSPAEAMGRWLAMHRLRTPTTDLPAVLCFLTAAVLGLQPVPLSSDL